jgi:hypothetical protein
VQLDWSLVDDVVAKLGTQLSGVLPVIDLSLYLVPFDDDHPKLRSVMTQRMVQFVQRFEPLMDAGITRVSVERAQLGTHELEAVWSVFGTSCQHLSLTGLPEGPALAPVLALLDKIEASSAGRLKIVTD